QAGHREGDGHHQVARQGEGQQAGRDRTERKTAGQRDTGGGHAVCPAQAPRPRGTRTDRQANAQADDEPPDQQAGSVVREQQTQVARGGTHRTGEHHRPRPEAVGQHTAAEQARQQAEGIDAEGTIEQHARNTELLPQHHDHGREMIGSPSCAEKQQDHTQENSVDPTIRHRTNLPQSARPRTGIRKVNRLKPWLTKTYSHMSPSSVCRPPTTPTSPATSSTGMGSPSWRSPWPTVPSPSRRDCSTDATADATSA